MKRSSPRISHRVLEIALFKLEPIIQNEEMQPDNNELPRPTCVVAYEHTSNAEPSTEVVTPPAVEQPPSWKDATFSAR